MRDFVRRNVGNRPIDIIYAMQYATDEMAYGESHGRRQAAARRAAVDRWQLRVGARHGRTHDARASAHMRNSLAHYTRLPNALAIRSSELAYLESSGGGGGGVAARREQWRQRVNAHRASLFTISDRRIPTRSRHWLYRAPRWLCRHKYSLAARALVY